MRSYYEHLSNTPDTSKEGILPKPILRSSAIFPVLQLPGISTRLLFMGYWLLKRQIRDITAWITLRSMQGEVLGRQKFYITEIKTYCIELTHLMENAGRSPQEKFQGSLEIEFYSTENLVFPFPAVVINYYGPAFSTVVHVAQRIYNDYEDMKKNSQVEVAESGFNIYVDQEKEPFISLINGPEGTQNSSMVLDFYNLHGEHLDHTIHLGTLAPYETRLIFPAQTINLREFLKGEVGSVKAKFHVDWVFPRLVVGNFLTHLPALMITHSYYDTTMAFSEKDYWLASSDGETPASLLIPAPINDPYFTSIYFYPIYSPANFAIDVEIFTPKGILLGTKKKAILLKPPFKALQQLNIKAICQELHVSLDQAIGAKINAYPIDQERLPARIKIGFDLGLTSQIPCNICVNMQPFNPSLKTKNKTFRWAPVLADQPKPMIWIMNASPKTYPVKEAEIEVTFFREQDTTTLSRHLKLPPNGFIAIYPNEEEELKNFFLGKIGWFTAVSTNPYTTTYYFAESALGLIGGDHGF